MPFGKWADFESCVVDIMKQNPDYDEETAKATCGKLKAQLEGKIFWQGTVNLVEGNKVTGQALHPIKTYHPNEWPQIRVYLEEELKKSAETLSGKPFGIDHILLLSQPNRITRAWWENDAINYEGDVDDKVAEMIRKGDIKGVSVEYNWDLLEKMNGFAPRGLEFTSLHFLKNLEPGDPSAYVKLAEAVLEKLKGETLRSQITTLTNEKKALEEALQAAQGRIKILEGGKASPAKPTLGEALINPAGSQPELVIPLAKVEGILPPLQAERSIRRDGCGYKLLQDLKKLIYETRKGIVNVERKK